MKAALVAPVLIAVAFASSAAAAKRAPVASPTAPIVVDGVEINILPRIAAGGSASVTEVGLDLEAMTADAATRLGFQSLRAVTDVDCGRGANRFISAVAYQQPSLGGPGRSRNITGQWVQPSSDSYMAAVIARVCASASVGHPAPSIKEMAAAPPPAAPAQRTAQALPPAAPASAPAASAPTPPQVVRFSGSPATAAPPPTEAATPAGPTPPLVVRFGGAPPKPTSSATASYLPKVAGERIAQVAASANVHDAEKVLRELKPLIAAPLTTTIEQAVVGGAHVYRADVVGFQTAAEAKAFCKSAAHVSKTCWVRARNDAPAAPAKAAKPPERLRPAKRAG